MNDSEQENSGITQSSPSRRGLLRKLGTASGVAFLGSIATVGAMNSNETDGTPKSAMAVPTAGPWRPAVGHVDVVFAVDTSQKLVALTFDDGPMANWTPMVHDVLDSEKVKATFCLVGKRLVKNAALVHGRMDRHEVANHTWAHRDLSKMSHEEALHDIKRCHEAIIRITGREPRHLRPPFGHLGGTTIGAAGTIGYDLLLWSVKMLEKTFENEPRKLVEYITNSTMPGTIILAHDTGNPDRLVALKNLKPMIKNIRAKGFEFVTVSELRAASS